MKFKLLLFLSLFTSHLFAIDFGDAILKLKKHESVSAMREMSLATLEEANLQGSWGDPKLKLAAKNYPKDTLKNDQTPMTGIEIGISQKIALTPKYGRIKDSYKSLAHSYDFEVKDREQYLTKKLWEVLVLQKRLKEEIKILRENDAWISKILKVSKRLYANGKISQQAILDIQIRKSEIELNLSNKEYEFSEIDERLIYLIGDSHINEKSIPWHILASSEKGDADNKELALKEKIKSKELKLSASRLNYIPDITFSVGYTKRQDLDGNGDFVGASVTFPIPLSSEKYANHKKVTHEKYVALKDYEEYKKSKSKESSILLKEIKKLEKQLDIFNNKTIKFATNSRSITAKSYGLGNSTYVELLQSELKLQSILMEKVMIEAKRDLKRVTLNYTLGRALHE